MLSLRYCSTTNLCSSCTRRFIVPINQSKLVSRLTNSNPKHSYYHFLKPNVFARTATSSSSISIDSPISGLEDVLTGYIFGKNKATQVAHQVWKHVVQKGDVVVDATCGNGYDTLALLKLVADESRTGCVFGFDIQKDALENTSSLLEDSVNPNERELVKLFPICHSRIEEVVPEGTFVRLLAFNLGYLPGGDKGIITQSRTTILALEAAKNILKPGGLISILVYVGHPGGREEYEAVQGFASRLPVENWVCCKFETLNRPLAPVIMFLFKR